MDSVAVSTPTARQLEILKFCASGMTREEIGGEMFISPYTVRWQLQEVRSRLEARNTSHAIAICLARGYLAVDGRSECLYIPRPLDIIAA